MPRVTKDYCTYSPKLNGWFVDALARLDTSDCWGTEIDPEPTNIGPGAKWLEDNERYDILNVAALIRLCATFSEDCDTLVDDLCNPFRFTVIETGDTDWISQFEDAVGRGILSAMRRKYSYLPKIEVLSPTSCSHSSNRQRQREEFEKTLNERLSERRPIVCVVDSLSSLPSGVQHAVTNTVKPQPLTRQMLLKLHSILHCPIKPTELSRAFSELPEDSEISRLGGTDVAIFLRHSNVVAMAKTVKSHFTCRKVNSNQHALAEVKGLGPSREVLEQLAEDMQVWGTGELPWSEIPHGLLVHGPPGTGKTFAAGKLAEQVGAHFVASSYSDWQKHGHLGDFIAAMHKSFEEARKHAPSILFIDEIDSFGDRSAANGDNENYIRSALNALLEQIDGTCNREGVLVVAACNFPEKLDAALVRSGRFDLKIEMPLPNIASMTEILLTHTKGTLPMQDISAVAAHLVGHSGADAGAVVRMARSFARQHKRTLTQQDLQKAALVVVPETSADDMRRAAVHEAGHIVVGHLMCHEVPARAEIGARGGSVSVASPGLYPTAHKLEQYLATLLGGRAAECVILNSVSSGAGVGKESDLAKATLLATQMETQFAFGSKGLVWQPVDDENLNALFSDPDFSKKVAQRLEYAENNAKLAIRSNRKLVQRLASILLERRQLSRNELKAILSPPLNNASGPNKARQLAV